MIYPLDNQIQLRDGRRLGYAEFDYQVDRS